MTRMRTEQDRKIWRTLKEDYIGKTHCASLLEDGFTTTILNRDQNFSHSAITFICECTSVIPGIMIINQGQDKFVYSCNNCKSYVEPRYHCTNCEDFDLCVQCYDKEGHPHEMEKLGFDSAEGSQVEEKKTSPEEARELAIQKCIDSFIHANLCQDANCRLISCRKVKRITQHQRVCELKTTGACPICKQLVALFCYHAKNCLEEKCPVPYCLSIKNQMKQDDTKQGVVAKEEGAIP